MAPKGKPDPKAAAKKPEVKAGPAKAGPDKGGPAKAAPLPLKPLTETEIMILKALVVTAALSIIAIIVTLIMYVTLHEFGTYTDFPMQQLRHALSSTFSNLKFDTDPPMIVADAVENLPIDIDNAEKDYEAKKKKYQSLFQKAMRSSTGPWKLHGKSLYYFAKEEKTWYDAEIFCISRGAHLASVLNVEEQNFIATQIETPSWIGLMGETRKGEWRWTDGFVLLKQYWSVGQSNYTQRGEESGQGCTVLVPSSTFNTWKTDNCHKFYRWVCKESLDSK